MYGEINEMNLLNLVFIFLVVKLCLTKTENR